MFLVYQWLLVFKVGNILENGEPSYVAGFLGTGKTRSGCCRNTPYCLWRKREEVREAGGVSRAQGVGGGGGLCRDGCAGDGARPAPPPLGARAPAGRAPAVRQSLRPGRELE